MIPFAPIFLKLHFAVKILISEFACKKSASYDNAKLCLNFLASNTTYAPPLYILVYRVQVKNMTLTARAVQGLIMLKYTMCFIIFVCLFQVLDFLEQFDLGSLGLFITKDYQFSQLIPSTIKLSM